MTDQQERERYEELKAKMEGRAPPHSPEPWSVEKYGDYPGRKAIKDATGDVVMLGLTYVHRPHHEDVDASSERLLRIVACVNFLRGVPTEELEKFMNVENTIDRMGNLADMGWI